MAATDLHDLPRATSRLRFTPITPWLPVQGGGAIHFRAALALSAEASAPGGRELGHAVVRVNPFDSATGFEPLGLPFLATAYDGGADPQIWTSMEHADASRWPTAFDVNLTDKKWRRAEIRVHRSAASAAAQAVVQVQITRHDDEGADDG